jgi:hypothetical protein
MRECVRAGTTQAPHTHGSARARARMQIHAQTCQASMRFLRFSISSSSSACSFSRARCRASSASCPSSAFWRADSRSRGAATGLRSSSCLLERFLLLPRSASASTLPPRSRLSRRRFRLRERLLPRSFSFRLRSRSCKRVMRRGASLMTNIDVNAIFVVLQAYRVDRAEFRLVNGLQPDTDE